MQPFLKTKQCIAIKEPRYPVCNQCIEHEMETWLEERKPKLISGLRAQFKKFNKIATYSNNLKCTICNKQKNECYYCFRNHIYQWIQKNIPKLSSSFKVNFF